MRQLIFLNGNKYDISGPAGNAFAVLGTVQSYLKQCSVSTEDIAEWHAEATAGGYDDLLRVCAEATGIEFIDRTDRGEWLN